MFTLNFLKWDNYDGFLLPACVKLVIILFFFAKDASEDLCSYKESLLSFTYAECIFPNSDQ